MPYTSTDIKGEQLLPCPFESTFNSAFIFSWGKKKQTKKNLSVNHTYLLKAILLFFRFFKSIDWNDWVGLLHG